MLCKIADEQIWCGTNNFHYKDLTSGNSTPVMNIPKNDEEWIQFENLMSERARLFFICFLGSLPMLLVFSFSFATFFLNSLIDEIVWVNLNAFYYLLIGIYHLQSPFLMLVLSDDFREEIQRDLNRLFGRQNAESSSF